MTRPAITVLMCVSALFISGCERTGSIAEPASDAASQPVSEPAPGQATPGPPQDGDAPSPGFWAQSSTAENTLLYGYSQTPPLLSLACAEPGQLTLTRFVNAPSEGKILAALLGNRKAARFNMDAQWNGRGWVWVGAFPANSETAELFQGAEPQSITMPGIGMVELAPSLKVQALVDACRQDQPESPA